MAAAASAWKVHASRRFSKAESVRNAKVQEVNGASDNTQIIKAWLSEFDEALQKQDISKIVTLFNEEECFWRDLLAFTWNLYTAESRDEIGEMMKSTMAATKPTGWELDGKVEEKDHVLSVFLKFETAIGRGRGYLRLLKGGKCWSLLTAMTELKGHEEPLRLARPTGVREGNVPGRKTWLEQCLEEKENLGYKTQPYVLIVGGGQAGIILAARLRMLKVPTIIVEKNAKPGDSWRNRYKSLCLHDPVWYDHLPYLPFPPNWPVFSPKDKIGDWLEAYTSLMELNYWSSTECKSASYNEEEGQWEVNVERSLGTSAKSIQLRPKHLVLATGMSGMPKVPKFPGAETFEGLQCHSSKFQSGEDWAGKQCVVVGSNTSAHDIGTSLWESGAASVTMVQRSSTHVLTAGTCLANLAGDGYREGGPPVDDVDLTVASLPYKVFHRFTIPTMQRIAKEQAPFYEGLTKAGFVLDWGDDGSGLFVKYLRRGGGYYIDVGASELVSNGSIKLKSRVNVVEIKPKSILLSDGSELAADLIVYATGYGNMNEWAAKLVSKEVADKVGVCWGLGSNTTNDPGPWERELRNMWKPTQQPGLWFMGGNLHQCRHYSLPLALQLKARMEGIATPSYGVPLVNHASF